RERARPAREMTEGGGRDRVDEQPDHDRRRRQHDVDDEARERGKARVRPVLGEMDPGQYADRRGDEGREGDHHRAADDRVRQPAALGAGRRRRLQEQVGAERREGGEARREQRPQDPAERCEPDRHRRRGQRESGGVDVPAATVAEVHRRAPRQARTPARAALRCTSHFASPSTTKVMTNSSRPSANSDGMCSAGSASANSLASVDAIELPGANRLAERRFALPITNVTAIVSPSARPSPSITPPTTPTRVYGSTMWRTTSQVVQPMPYADSFSIGGTVSKTSRMTEATKGTTISASTTPAVKMPMPSGGPAKTGRPVAASSGCTC